MALDDDVPLGEAGRDYYARRYGDRVQNVRKFGAAPPAATAPRSSGCLGVGGGMGGGVVALLVVIRIIAAIAVGVGDSGSNSSYNNYNTYTPPPPIHFDQQPDDWKNQIQVDPSRPGFQPDDPIFRPNADRWQDQPVFPPVNPPGFPPDDPIIRPNNPPFILPPNVPGPNDDDDKVPGKND